MLSETNTDEFVWPSTVALSGSGSFEIDQSPDIGMLVFLGYHVGRINGLNVGTRRVILDHVYLGTLPPFEGPAYYKSWGEPESATRLQKLAESIASFTRSAKRRGRVRMSDAISDWEADLDYLKLISITFTAPIFCPASVLVGQSPKHLPTIELSARINPIQSRQCL